MNITYVGQGKVVKTEKVIYKLSPAKITKFEPKIVRKVGGVVAVSK